MGRLCLTLGKRKVANTATDPHAPPAYAGASSALCSGISDTGRIGTCSELGVGLHSLQSRFCACQVATARFDAGQARINTGPANTGFLLGGADRVEGTQRRDAQIVSPRHETTSRPCSGPPGSAALSRRRAPLTTESEAPPQTRPLVRAGTARTAPAVIGTVRWIRVVRPARTRARDTLRKI